MTTRARIDILFLLMALLGSAINAQEPQEKSREQLLPTFSQAKVPANAQTPAQFPPVSLKWKWPAKGFYTQDTPADALRVRFRIERFSEENSWEILIFNSSSLVVDRLTRESFVGASPEAFAWSKRIIGNSFRVELRSNGDPEGLVLVVDRINYPFFKAAPKAIVGDEDLRDLVASYGRGHKYYKYSLPIVFLFIVKAEAEDDTNCTGFLLAPDLLITNNHCISQPWQLRTIDLRYNYEPGWKPQNQFNLENSTIVAQNPALDYTLVKLSRVLPLASVVKLDLTPVKKGEQLVIIQHPNMKIKTINVIDCKVDVDHPRSAPSDFTNRCDAEGGSSGSPVMRESTGKVMGLHYGGVWDGDPKKNRNFAVRISLILDDVNLQNPTAYQQIVQANQTP